ncbi:MAG: DNA-directed RNA polymerase subunit omega [Clostridia bacterium]|nr:DNA-directed RNA polymerase subunit omega [Clostridia bacterium]
MIKPSIEELTSNGLNRYEVVVATAKCARMLTDEYCEKRAIAEKLIANKETDKSLAALLKDELSDERAVTSAVRRIYDGEFEVSKVVCECESCDAPDTKQTAE